jgi:hypothetical protein
MDGFLCPSNSFCDMYSEKGGYRNLYVHVYIPMAVPEYSINYREGGN